MAHVLELKAEYQSLLTSVNNDNWQGLHPNATEAVPLPDGGEKHFSQVTNLLFPKMHPNSLNRQKKPMNQY